MDTLSEFEREYEARKWAVGTGLWRDYRKEYALKKAAFLELKEIYDRLGEKQFLYLISSCIISTGGSCSLDDLLDENEKLKQKYEKELTEFNKKFLSTNLTEININSTMKFLSNSLAVNNISKDFIENINSKNGIWETLKLKFAATEIENKGKWFNVEMESETIANEIMEADNLALTNNFETAIQVYETLLMNRMVELDTALIINIFYKIILCALSIPNIPAAKTRLQMGEHYSFFKKSSQYNFLHKLLFHIQLHDLPGYVSLLNETKTDLWSSTILLKIKEEIFFLS